MLLEPARGVVRLAAQDLRLPDRLGLGRDRDRLGRRRERPQGPEEVLLERVGLGCQGLDAPTP
ncbi:MAG TPA: hypothetical protein VI503_05905 [Gaiellaceae bacterium]|nr:hypothetical protein [Gaiellaceae bacterium]